MKRLSIILINTGAMYFVLVVYFDGDGFPFKLIEQFAVNQISAF